MSRSEGSNISNNSSANAVAAANSSGSDDNDSVPLTATDSSVTDSFNAKQQHEVQGRPYYSEDQLQQQYHQELKQQQQQQQKQQGIKKEEQQLMKDLLQTERWGEVEQLCEINPVVAKAVVPMICQGERVLCSPLHVVAGNKRTSPVSTIDKLVTANPLSLLCKDDKTNRLPLHMAIINGGASYSAIRYLCEAMPSSLKEQDVEGNTPLHYAVAYSSEAIISLLLSTYPKGCQISNTNGRLPLHLICTRCWDYDKEHNPALSPEIIKRILESYVPATKHKDRHGRLPLHILCATNPAMGKTSSQPRWDVLDLVINYNTNALLTADDSNHNPLQLLKMISASSSSPSSSLFYHDNDVVLAYMQERTNRERRCCKKKPLSVTTFLPSHKSTTGKNNGDDNSSSSNYQHSRRNRRRKKIQMEESMRYCYG